MSPTTHLEDAVAIEVFLLGEGERTDMEAFEHSQALKTASSHDRYPPSYREFTMADLIAIHHEHEDRMLNGEVFEEIEADIEARGDLDRARKAALWLCSWAHIPVARQEQKAKQFAGLVMEGHRTVDDGSAQRLARRDDGGRSRPPRGDQASLRATAFARPETGSGESARP